MESKLKEMNTITENNLHALADMFSPSTKSESEFQGHKIVVEQAGDYYDYEIFIQDPIYGKWHTWHYEYDSEFETEEAARIAAEKWIDNYDGPGDDYYAQ